MIDSHIILEDPTCQFNSGHHPVIVACLVMTFMFQTVSLSYIPYSTLSPYIHDLYIIGSPQRISTTVMNITVVDGNDNAPEFSGTPYMATINEGFFNMSQLILTVNATDPDSGTNADVTYSIADGMVDFIQIDPMTVSGWTYVACIMMFTLTSFTSNLWVALS